MKKSPTPGRVPATYALRVLLEHAGIKNPATKKPFTEAMLFGIAGGIGIGVAAFHYAKENFSSFFIAGRHSWFDDLLYLQGACDRLGIKTKVLETGSAKQAEKQLREALETGPCIAWVDMAHLPHRALPKGFSGSGYHVVTIEKIEGEQAFIHDLMPEPISISLADLATARARIDKQKNRLLSLVASSSTRNESDLHESIAGAMKACKEQFIPKKGAKGPYAMSTLESLRRWADRLHGSNDKESWERLFPPGINFWRGLTSIHLFIERYGTGGGLCRPIMAEFLKEAGMKDGAKLYAKLGQQWSELAKTALPDGVPMFKEARELQIRYGKLLMSGGGIADKQGVWKRLDELQKEAAACFPLNETQCEALRAELKRRLEEIIANEIEALGVLG